MKLTKINRRKGNSVFCGVMGFEGLRGTNGLPKRERAFDVDNWDIL